MFAALPMYDWPEIRADTDRFWTAIRAALADHGVAAPPVLDRATPAIEGWLRSDLLLSQTCGYPYVTALRGKVTLVGAPVWALPDLPPGEYCSRIIIHADDPSDTASAFHGKTVAFNAPDSQSGTHALRTVIAPLAENGRFFGRTLETGSHHASISAVAKGQADIAAIDAISFELARRHHPDTARVRVFASTAPMPALPYVTARTGPRDRLASALAEAITALDQATRNALVVSGFVPLGDTDYDRIVENAASADRLGYPRLA